ncbi:type II toxin-antitoxin system VapC family toxin [Candidatus Entotheonella palauensis]|uniref:type II toxin-antitoxin system VapC family toxin n=1 Tax=Candidatus Entotheonella palauensis TaxID=93172 RepID=UPI000B7CF44F|nr:type II toxin-antitoxin system VapC family toxin [Candidatus Entotheonella palauensis]
MSFLLDTNVISELRKGSRCNSFVANWFDTIEDHEVYLSVLVIGEIRKGIELVRRNDHLTAARLEHWLQQIVDQYSDRILPIDQSVAEEWGRLNAPNPLPTIDALLAATAKIHHFVLATRNVDDIKRTGVSYINPFDAPV